MPRCATRRDPEPPDFSSQPFHPVVQTDDERAAQPQVVVGAHGVSVAVVPNRAVMRAQPGRNGADHCDHASIRHFAVCS